MPTKKNSSFFIHTQRNIFAGILTVIPIWFTYVVFKFFFEKLSQVGMPWAEAVSEAVQKKSPNIADWIIAPWFLNTLSVMLTVLALYLLGWIAARVIGRQFLKLIDSFITSIPLVQSVYGAVKKFISVLQQKPGDAQRVVLIQFPSKDMKTVGFITRILHDQHTNEELAAVYVPTTPNPTSGYLEIVPLKDLIQTDWTMDEAMSFIISGGAIAPDHISYSQSVSSSAPTFNSNKTK